MYEIVVVKRIEDVFKKNGRKRKKRVNSNRTKKSINIFSKMKRSQSARAYSKNRNGKNEVLINKLTHLFL